MRPRHDPQDSEPFSMSEVGLRAGGERLAWLAVGLWSLCIFAAIPVARTIQEFVSDHWGRSAFGWVVIAAVTASASAAVVAVSRKRARRTSRAGAAWLVATAAVFIASTVELWRSPEEALHFVQYGLLGILLHLALRHRLRDAGIYLVAAAMGASVGIIDETIQWITPGRIWGLRDIWLNFFACALVQVAIAKGIRPTLLGGPPGPRSVRWLCRTLGLALLLLGMSLLNTPSRIRWYAERVPGLAFLVTNESVMVEFGHLYDDPETGRFRSRFSRDELRAIDSQRAAEAAAVLDQYRGEEAYHAFLERYTPISDPFLHEMRVHLFRRDRYLRNARKHPDDELERRKLLSVAYHENRILEKYFGETLRVSNYTLTPDELTRMKVGLLPDWNYESGVSSGVVTSVTEGAVLSCLLASLAALLGIDRRYGRGGDCG